MSKPQKIMELLLDYSCLVSSPVEMTEDEGLKRKEEIEAKFQVIADRQDRLLEIARFYLDELVYNDYVSRDFREIVEVKKLIAECEGEK